MRKRDHKFTPPQKKFKSELKEVENTEPETNPNTKNKPISQNNP